MVSEPLSKEEMRQRLAAGLHALDCTRCHRGAYCGGIDDDDLGRAELLMDDVVTDLLAARTQALEAEVERLRAGLQQLIDHSWAQYEASDYSELVSLGDVAKRLTALLFEVTP